MKEYLQSIIDYIDEHIAKPTNLDAIEEYIGFSKFYLNHLFSVYTGYSIMAYVRKKKLEYALDELKSNKRIVDIALEIGYSSERSFARAIQKEYGHSPAYFRNNEVLKTRTLVVYDLSLDVSENKIYSKFPANHESIKNIISKKGIEEMKKYLSDVSYTIIDPMTVLGCTIYGSDPEEQVIELMHQLAKAYNLKPLREFGFDSPVESAEDVINYRGYEFWLAVTEEDLECLPSRETFEWEGHTIVVKDIPAYRYATIRVEDPFSNPFERITGGWKFLVGWLEDHDFAEVDFHNPGLDCKNINCLEEVKEVEGITVMDLYIPVDRA